MKRPAASNWPALSADPADLQHDAVVHHGPRIEKPGSRPLHAGEQIGPVRWLGLQRIRNLPNELGPFRELGGSDPQGLRRRLVGRVDIHGRMPDENEEVQPVQHFGSGIGLLQGKREEVVQAAEIAFGELGHDRRAVGDGLGFVPGALHPLSELLCHLLLSCWRRRRESRLHGECLSVQTDIAQPVSRCPALGGLPTSHFAWSSSDWRM